MSTQAQLNFELAEPSVKTLVDMVKTLLADGRWWTPWELCDEIWRTRSIRISDSSCTARLRDLRKPQYGGRDPRNPQNGGHAVTIRKRAGTKAYEYRLEG